MTNEESINKAIGCKILEASFSKDDYSRDGSDAKIEFQLCSGATLAIWDSYQHCCEHRYITCDDDLESFQGATICSIEECPVEGGNRRPHRSEDYYHDTVFVRIGTDRGVIVLTSHNEHNGAYGGFNMRVNFTGPELPKSAHIPYWQHLLNDD